MHAPQSTHAYNIAISLDGFYIKSIARKNYFGVPTVIQLTGGQACYCIASRVPESCETYIHCSHTLVLASSANKNFHAA